MPAPLVSIILPVHNAQPVVARALASLRAQTLPDWEILAVDDGSTDDTRAVLQAAAAADPRVRLLEPGRVGLVGALNAGLAAARGEFIARMDADDEAHPARLEAQVGLLRERPEIGLVSCLVGFGGDRAASAGYAVHVDWLNSVVTPEEIALNRFVESPLAHPSVLFRRGLVAEHGGYRDGPFPEDYELWLRWLDAGVRMAKVPRVLLTWHDSPARLSRVDPRYDPEAFFRLKAPWIASEIRRRVGRDFQIPPRGAPAPRKVDDRTDPAQNATPATPPDPAEIWIWGAGRPTRKRAAHLLEHGMRIAGYIDVDAKKTGRQVGGVPVITPAGLPAPGERFVLTYVSTRGARDLIRRDLVTRGYVEGRDFLACA